MFDRVLLNMYLQRDIASGREKWQFELLQVLKFHTAWTQWENGTFIRRSEDVYDIFWTSCGRPIYVLCPGVIYDCQIVSKTF